MAPFVIRAGGWWLLLATLAGGAQAGEEWIPLAEGMRWVFQSKVTTRAAVVGTTREGKVTATVTRREKLGDAEWFRLEWKDDQGDLDAVHWVRADASKVEVGRSSDDHLLLVPATLTPGSTQPDTKVQLNDTVLVLREVKVGTLEKVAAPIGEKEALPVESRTEAPATRITTRVWYARGVGPVKVVETVEAPATRVTRELLLVSVEQGAVAATPTPPAAPEVERPAGGKSAAAATAAPTALIERAKALLGGKEEEWGKLEEGARAALAAADKAQPQVPTETPWVGARLRMKDVEVVAGNVKEARVTAAEGCQVPGTLRQSLVVVQGSLVVSGQLRDSVVVVLGDAELSGNVHDCLILVSGRLKITGNLHDSAAAAGGLEVLGNVHDCLLQAPSAVTLGNLHDNLLVGPKGVGGKNNREVDGPDLWVHFAK